MKFIDGLSDDINKNILASELNGGVWLKDVPVGGRIIVQTRNTRYVIERMEYGDTIMGSERFCPTPTLCNIHGSTWGGSMIKLKFIGVGMHLEFTTENHPTPIVTSTIQSVEVE